MLRDLLIEVAISAGMRCTTDRSVLKCSIGGRKPCFVLVDMDSVSFDDLKGLLEDTLRVGATPVVVISYAGYKERDLINKYNAFVVYKPDIFRPLIMIFTEKKDTNSMEVYL